MARRKGLKKEGLEKWHSYVHYNPVNKELYLIIHNVRSAHNVGSLFRTADGMGVQKVYLTGYTGAPVDRFGRKDQKISKVSLGAENTVPWEQGVITNVIMKLKERNVEIAALEQTKNSIPLHTYHTEKSTALIVGNEVEGLPGAVLATSDVAIEIPMLGEKESLNVAVAAAIALYYVRAN